MCSSLICVRPCLAHEWHAGAHVSAHAVAPAPHGPWRLVPDPPYTRSIEWADGSTTDVYTRERPQLIFAAAAAADPAQDDRRAARRRVPVALSNGVTPGNATMPGALHGYTGDYSYTHVQRLRAT